MENVCTIQQYIDLFTEILKVPVTETEFTYRYTLDEIRPGYQLEVFKDRLYELITIMGSKNEDDNTILYDNKSYEILLSEETRSRPPILYKQDSIVKEDEENGFTYTISRPTDEYLLFIIAKINELNATDLIKIPLRSYYVNQYFENTTSDITLFGLLKVLLPRSMTLQITSTKNRGLADFAALSNALLFSLTYNLDRSLIESRTFDDFLRPSRIAQTRRSKIGDIDAPKRLYIRDLTYYYQMGVATDNPVLEYLSYYHVAEHFFEEVYTDDLIENVKNKITMPDFSYRRKKDVGDLIKYINKRLKLRAETVTFSEQEALRLTLSKLVNLPEVIDKLQNYDPSLILYYGTTIVPFSDGDAVDLLATDRDALTDMLSKRVYKTRNSIVHSKENEKSKYIPFLNDKHLVREVPLLRFIAESIILNKSTIMGA